MSYFSEAQCIALKRCNNVGSLQIENYIFYIHSREARIVLQNAHFFHPLHPRWSFVLAAILIAHVLLADERG